ncbi:MAG: hypothetical protein IJT23_02135 [Clostridia bacterium]|nr:hypothetical protein [Clostridia bacterium]
MNAAYIYLQLYKLFDNTTPTKVDCGKLCDSACCKGDSESGMFLFPGEYEVYKLLEPGWAKIEKTDMTYKLDDRTYTVPILLCNGSCDRYQRPLSCRIFPLTPYLNKDNKLEIITDPRAKGICPLAKAFFKEDYDEQFLKNLNRTFNLLLKNDKFKAFMSVYSEYLDTFRKFTD